MRTCWARKPVRSLRRGLEDGLRQEERRNKLHTKPGVKPRRLKAVMPLLPARHLGKSTSRGVPPIPSSACADLAKTNRLVALSQVC